MLTDGDRAQLAGLGISDAEAAAQLRIFAAPPPPTRLDRPCTVGDGIIRLGEPEHHTARQAFDRAAAAGRLTKFLPASGAATRMFQALLAVRGSGGELSRAQLERQAAAGDLDAGEVLALVDNLPRFAFAAALRAVVSARGGDLEELRRRGDIGTILAALLDGDGLGYAALPKALLLFHRYSDGSRTAFEEHLVESAATAGGTAPVRVHLTISPEHAAGFHDLLRQVQPQWERRCGVRFAVDFSHQKSATDTLAVDLDNRPLRSADGRLVLRPGGHGALIENLNDLRGDIVLVKTIDNILPEHRRAASVQWLRALAGHLAAVQEALFAHLERVHRQPVSAVVREARNFAAATLGLTVPDGADAAALIASLDRPLRVCGMVRNTGEPGGGPFWVRQTNSECTPQIVESAQIDAQDSAQRVVFAAATHFNPVVLACGVRDWRGAPFDLRRFVDASAVFIARKSKDGRDLKALERPGLWNGAMAGWHTLFVELPDTTFAPVKTVNDLLRPAHQPAEERADETGAAASGDVAPGRH